MGVPPVVNVLICPAPAHNLLTTIPLTNGDNAGVAMGVASGLVMGPEHTLVGSFTCLIGCAPAARMTSMGITNNTNCPNMQLVPGQVRVLILAP